ncbi:hypothetical protein [Bradyrhizobium zhanjiangense]|uniref:hypothetical protein n=1 Tax=Bradyrhizobium zhanjiangense TaxID=1325107 RepID=UPI001008BF71|nr:hypothetical protein [Bradyrhizobium zhanjiangense]
MMVVTVAIRSVPDVGSPSLHRCFVPFPNLTQMLLDVVVALTENLLDLDAAQGVDAVKPPNARTLAALCFSPDDLPY